MNIDTTVQIKFDSSIKGIVIEEILQNLRLLFSTPAGTVPFDRSFGIDWSIVDKPLQMAKGLLTVEYIEKVKKYEPRAKVKRVTFNCDGSKGILIPRVVIGLV